MFQAQHREAYMGQLGEDIYITSAQEVAPSTW